MEGPSIPVDEEAIISERSGAVSNAKPGVNEKRRLAALKTWEKRRAAQGIVLSGMVTPNDDESIASEVQIDSNNASAKHKGPKGSKSHKRRLAALKSWEKRKRKANTLSGQAAVVTSNVDEPIVSDMQEVTDDAASDTSPDPIEDKSIKRRLAALKSWEKRKKQARALQPEAVTSSSDIECNTGQAHKENETVIEMSPSKRVYTAELRSLTAKAAWEKRKRKLQAAKKLVSNVVTDITSTEDDAAASKQVEIKSTAQAAKKRKKHQTEPTRSRPRRDLQEEEDTVGGTGDANELITRLRRLLGWMEFHPSSRYGNGTADYCYIPGSLAQLIRNGAFSKPIVLEHGTLGVHYAFDYEGYGGLKAMIETFGEDYSPCPTDQMMEASLDLQDKKDAKMEQWYMDEDLPWKEVTDLEDKKMKQKCAERREELEARLNVVAPSSDVPDIEEVADILASLIQDDVEIQQKAATQDDVEIQQKEASQDDAKCTLGTTTAPGINTAPGPPKRDATSNGMGKEFSQSSPALSALQCYDSDEDSTHSNESNQVSKPLADEFDDADCIIPQNYIDNPTSQDGTDAPLDPTAPCGMFGIPLYSEQIIQHPTLQFSEDGAVRYIHDNSSLVLNNN